MEFRKVEENQVKPWGDAQHKENYAKEVEDNGPPKKTDSLKKANAARGRGKGKLCQGN